MLEGGFPAIGLVGNDAAQAPRQIQSDRIHLHGIKVNDTGEFFAGE